MNDFASIFLNYLFVKQYLFNMALQYCITTHFWKMGTINMYIPPTHDVLDYHRRYGNR